MAPLLTRRRLLATGLGTVAAAGTAVGYAELRGRHLWSVDPHPGGYGPAHPQLVDGTLYVVSGGRVVALDPDTGEATWSSPADPLGDRRGSIKYPPAIADGEAYVGTDGGVSAHEIGSADARWRFERGDLWGAAVAVGDEFVFAGSGGAALYCIDRADGSERWRLDLPSSVTGSPVYDSGVVYVPAADAVRAVDYAGDVAWEAPAWGASTLALGTDDVIVTDEYGARAIDEGTGRQRWESHPSTVGPPAVGADRVFTGGAEGAAHALRASDGTSEWYFRTGRSGFGGGEPRMGAPVHRDGTVYLTVSANVGAGLYALDAETGERRWRYGLDNPSSYPPAVGDDRAYVASDDGVHAVSLRARLAF